MILTKLYENHVSCGDELLLNNTIEIPTMTIVVRVVFHENNKYYPQIFLDECLHKF